jgi:hypothetical protein
MSYTKTQSQQDKLNDKLNAIPKDSNAKTGATRGSQLASALKMAFSKAKSERIGDLTSA